VTASYSTHSALQSKPGADAPGSPSQAYFNRLAFFTFTPPKATTLTVACSRSKTTRPNPNEPRALRARWVFPATREPLAHGVVTLAQGRIVSIDSQPPPGVQVEDLGNVALLPALVNAHVHLEFSCLKEPLGTPGMEFADWLRLVIERFRSPRADRLKQSEHPKQADRPEQIDRLEQADQLKQTDRTAQTDHAPHTDRPPQTDRTEAIRRGLEETSAAGVGLLGEIAQSDWQPALFDAARVQAVVFLEMIGPEPARAETALQAARQHIARGRTAGNWRPGLSPHAPYTVLPELLHQAVSLSAEHRLPLAMHLAESEAEVEWLRSGGGPLGRLLAERGNLRPERLRLGTRPGDYLHVLNKAHRLLVVHGNYLSEDEIEWLASHAPHAAVVYCPRTHARFEYPPYPLPRMLKAGLTVALGTDSRASAPDLDLLAEMRFAARRHCEVGPEHILRMATLFGARALGQERDLGAIEPGYQADLCAVKLPEYRSTDPYELLFDSQLPVVGRWFGGRRVGLHCGP